MTDPKIASCGKIDQTLQRLNDLAGQYLADQVDRSSQAHSQFLHSRSVVLRQIGDLVRMQAEVAGEASGERRGDASVYQVGETGAAENGLSRAVSPAEKRGFPVLFDREMLEEFAAGSVERCLGPEYAVFRNQRIPRIPNGVLLLMDRVLEIRGTRGQLSQPHRKNGLPSEILTEYDVPVDAWFIADNASAATPYAVLMEMALQPCGFLSAYLGTMLISPKSNLYFRNLDGEARLERPVDLRGKTVTGWARMTGHTVNEETVIQKFDFRLETDGVPFYSGTSIFGFFPEETMLRKVGLDNGKPSLPLYMQPTAPQAPVLTGSLVDLRNPAKKRGFRTGLTDPFSALSRGRLALLDEVYFEPTGGTFGKGYIAASREIRAQDWYFTNHFYQDPVMPGSLGVEAILEAMRVFAIAQGLTGKFSPSHFELVDGLVFQWKYRGQILREVKKMMVEIQIKRIEETPQGPPKYRGLPGASAIGIEIEGDASLWADNIRIYQVKNASLRIAKG